MSLAQCTVGRILHDKKRRIVVYAKVQYAHNMWMRETSNGLCLGEKVVHGLRSEPRMQDFDGGLSLEIDMLTKVDISKATFSYQADQAIVAQLIACTVHHLRTPFLS